MRVDAQVSRQVSTGEFGEVLPIMQDRPKNAVGETVVIFFVILTEEIGNNVFGAVHFGTVNLKVLCLVDRPTAPAHPHAFVAGQKRPERHF